MSNVDLRLGDCIEWAKNYRGEKFHALLCDPPYELGFMGRTWDKSGIAFKPETWAAFSDVLYDGAFVMAFASSRGWHRLACAIEDAGFVIHPSIFMLGWSYGSGFPKATRVRGAKEFEGHRYGLQALKPALEPIIVFQKPYRGKPVENITRTGAGALWIDGGRIGYLSASDKENNLHRPPMHRDGATSEFPQHREWGEWNGGIGRWASNFVLVCAPECVGDKHAPDCPAALLDEQSGVSKSIASSRNTKPSGKQGSVLGLSKWDNRYTSGEHYSGTGGASRFFFRAQWDALEAADPIRYVAKASRKERNAGLDNLPNIHPTLKPIALAKYLSTLLLPPAEYAPRRIFVPFAGVSSEMIGAMQAGWEEIVGVEREAEYVEIGNARIEYWKAQKEKQMNLPLEYTQVLSET